jgi:hypothetical protein
MLGLHRVITTRIVRVSPTSIVNNTHRTDTAGRVSYDGTSGSSSNKSLKGFYILHRAIVSDAFHQYPSLSPKSSLPPAPKPKPSKITGNKPHSEPKPEVALSKASAETGSVSLPQSSSNCSFSS